MTINSNHQNSKHDYVDIYAPECKEKNQKDTLFWIHVYINLLKILKSYCQ
jgi:hypothetical protein